MTREKEFGHKALGAEYCAGYVDEHKHWNNGFLCPGRINPMTGAAEYCCGAQNNRYCCIEEQLLPRQDTVNASMQTVIPAVLIGVALGLLLILVICTLLVCYFYEYCPLYKRRTKRCQHDFVLYDGDATAYTNELVPRKYSQGKEEDPCSPHNTDVTTPQENTYLKCNDSNSQCKQSDPPNLNHTHQYSTSSNTDSRENKANVSTSSCGSNRFGAFLSAVGLTRPTSFISTRRKPHCVASGSRTERDSGCFLTAADCDSRVCLCDNDTLGRHTPVLSDTIDGCTPAPSMNGDVCSHSWPREGNIYEEISREEDEDRQVFGDDENDDENDDDDKHVEDSVVVVSKQLGSDGRRDYV